MSKMIIPSNPSEINRATPIQVLSIYPKRSGGLRALASVRVGSLEIRNLRIVKDGEKSAFVQWPQQQGADNNGWWPLVKCHNPALDMAVKNAVLEAWEAAQSGGAA